MHRGHCYHCGTFALIVARGLCNACSRNHEIRDRYPRLRQTRMDYEELERRSKETVEDLEKLILERYPTMDGITRSQSQWYFNQTGIRLPVTHEDNSEGADCENERKPYRRRKPKPKVAVVENVSGEVMEVLSHEVPAF